MIRPRLRSRSGAHSGRVGASAGVVPLVPPAGPARVAWWDSLTKALRADACAQRLQLCWHGGRAWGAELVDQAYRAWLHELVDHAIDTSTSDPIDHDHKERPHGHAGARP